MDQMEVVLRSLDAGDEKTKRKGSRTKKKWNDARFGKKNEKVRWSFSFYILRRARVCLAQDIIKWVRSCIDCNAQPACHARLNSLEVYLILSIKRYKQRS